MRHRFQAQVRSNIRIKVRVVGKKPQAHSMDKAALRIGSGRPADEVSAAVGANDFFDISRQRGPTLGTAERHIPGLARPSFPPFGILCQIFNRSIGPGEDGLPGGLGPTNDATPRSFRLLERDTACGRPGLPLHLGLALG